MKAVCRQGLEKQPTFNELVEYIETNADTIKLPRRVKAFENAIYRDILDTARVIHERCSKNVRRPQEYQQDPSNLAPPARDTCHHS